MDKTATSCLTAAAKIFINYRELKIAGDASYIDDGELILA